MTDFPYKGIKGYGSVKIVDDLAKLEPLVAKINLKYLGTLDHQIAKMLMENARNGIEILLKINPKFFSTWDFGKTQLSLVRLHVFRNMFYYHGERSPGAKVTSDALLFKLLPVTFRNNAAAYYKDVICALFLQ